MHDLAKERLGALTERVTFAERDLRGAGWMDGLSPVDAVVTIQAVHELRHKRHALLFYRAILALVKTNGVLLVCDHVIGEGGMNDAALYMTPDEQLSAIVKAGFPALN